jgi:hypothetical protein
VGFSTQLRRVEDVNKRCRFDIVVAGPPQGGLLLFSFIIVAAEFLTVNSTIDIFVLQYLLSMAENTAFLQVGAF